MRGLRLWLPILLLGMLIACGQAPSEDGAQVVAEGEPAHGDIAWYEGSVDEAFAFAKSEGRPIFLYWGAIWCPPCHYLKTKIFTRDEFLEASRRLVMVYLDGDTERAQIDGERFGVQGYPTVILFDPSGQEITRMPSSLPIDRYADLLATALTRLRPVKEIFGDVMAAGPATADPVDLRLLAFYSWSQDHALGLSPGEKLAAFRRLHAETPTALEAERASFLALYLATAGRLSEQDDTAAPQLKEVERRELEAAVLALLDNASLRRSSLGLLFYGSRETIELLHPSPSPERDALIAAWERAVMALEDDESLAVDDRLTALYPRLVLARLAAQGEGGVQEDDEAALPAELVERVRQRVVWAGTAANGESEMQAVVSTMASLLEEASLAGEAETLLSERMEQTAAPYYYMSWLASLKEEAGQTDEAVALYRQAYDSANGRYTRFRYGSSYLRQLMKLRPDAVDTVEADSLAIVDELLSHDDAFSGGNHTRLEQLADAYVNWNEGGRHDAVIGRVRERVHAACERYVSGEDGAQHERCLAFLAAGSPEPMT